MQIVTGFEKYIVHQKLLVDVEIYQSRWSQGTYSCISELINSKIKCLCPSCLMVRQQINIQLNLLFNWTNRFKVEEGQKDIAWKICEYIFSLIEKTHKGFFAAVNSSCNTDRLFCNNGVSVFKTVQHSTDDEIEQLLCKCYKPLHTNVTTETTIDHVRMEHIGTNNSIGFGGIIGRLCLVIGFLLTIAITYSRMCRH